MPYNKARTNVLSSSVLVYLVLFTLPSLVRIYAIAPAKNAERVKFLTDVFSLNWEYRKNISLDGTWEFCRDPNNAGKEMGWHKGKSIFSDKIIIPGAPQAQGYGKPTYRQKTHFIEPFWIRKQVVIPTLKEDERMWLRIGGILPAGEIYINDEYVGYTKSSRTQQRVDITNYLKVETKNLIAIKVCDLPLVRLDGLWEMFELFKTWTGVYRPVRLEITNEVSIVDIYVMPDIAKGKLIVDFELSQLPRSALTAILSVKDNNKVIGKQRIDITDGMKNMKGTVYLQEYQTWSPDNPKLYVLEVSLVEKGSEHEIDKVGIKFGMRKFEAKGAKFYLNGRQIFIKCFGDDQLYPYTLAPPADINYHLRNLQKAREYGMNCVKSCVEVFSQDYIEAADQAGIMIIQEMPFGLSDLRTNRHTINKEFRDYYFYELEGLIKESRNNASVVAYSMSSELDSGSQNQESFDFFNKQLPLRAKNLAPHALVTDCTGHFIAAEEINKGRRVTDMYVVSHPTWMKEVLDETTFKSDNRHPAILHEYNWWSCYPDPCAKSKYDNTQFIPYWLDELVDTAAKNGQKDLIPLYRKNSLWTQAICRKDGIEYARRNEVAEGYILWLLTDLIQCSEGLLDDFWEEKNVSAKEFLKSNGDTVILLAKEGNRCFKADQEIEIPLAISHYGETNLINSTLRWRLVRDNVKFEDGFFEISLLKQGELTQAGTVELNLPNVQKGYKFEVEVELMHNNKTINTNNWSFWAFPEIRNEIRKMVRSGNTGQIVENVFLRRKGNDNPIPENIEIVIADKLDNELAKYIENGGRCLFFARDVNIENRTCYTPNSTFYKNFRTIPWNAGSSGNLGTVITCHPALENFPHDQMCDLHFVKMITGILPMHFEPLRQYGVKPIIRAIDHYIINRNNAYMLEFKVGKGKVFVTTFCILDTLEKHTAVKSLKQQAFVSNYNIEALNLLQCLVDYVKSTDFNPKSSVPYDVFIKLFSQHK